MRHAHATRLRLTVELSVKWTTAALNIAAARQQGLAHIETAIQL
jgi:hypothetical protein